MVFKNKAHKAFVFIKTQAWTAQSPMHSQAGSIRKNNRLGAELGFELKMKVVGFFEIYNFNEENFFKF